MQRRSGCAKKKRGIKSLHSRRKHPPLRMPEKTAKLKFRNQESLEEIHFFNREEIPAFHCSLDGIADDTVEENWTPEELNVAQLKEALSKRNLSTSGRRRDLVPRLSKQPSFCWPTISVESWFLSFLLSVYHGEIFSPMTTQVKLWTEREARDERSCTPKREE